MDGPRGLSHQTLRYRLSWEHLLSYSSKQLKDYCGPKRTEMREVIDYYSSTNRLFKRSSSKARAEESTGGVAPERR